MILPADPAPAPALAWAGGIALEKLDLASTALRLVAMLRVAVAALEHDACDDPACSAAVALARLAAMAKDGA